MQEELFVIRDLNKIDTDISTARQRLSGMIAAVTRTTGSITRQKAELAEVSGKLEVVSTEERKLNRRMEEYILRRDRTRKLIDEGRAPDFMAARKQLEQCTEIVDELELEVLERIERREELEAEIAERQQALEAVRVKDAAGRSRYGAEAPKLKAAIAELTAQRPALLERLNPDHRRIYQDHHELGQVAMTHIKDRICMACNREAPPQVILEVEHGRRIHRCRGCDRFFFSVIQPELEESG